MAIKTPATKATAVEDTGMAFVTRKVVTETTPISTGPDGTSFGQLLDEHLAKCARNGDVVESVEFTIREDRWFATRGLYVNEADIRGLADR